MRDFQLPGRSPAVATHGMAATSHPLATLTALDVLRDGGNAVDAAIAACAVQCVVEPHNTTIGGDCFVLYAPGGGDEVVALNGSGGAPAAAAPAWFAEAGITEVGVSSPHSVTIPGAVDAWARLAADHGSKSLGALLKPAMEFAEAGVPVPARTAADWDANAPVLRDDADAVRILLPGGRAPAPGEIHRQPELADTLRVIAEQGRAGFYEGAVAADMVERLRSLGGLHTLDDFAAHRSDYVTPIKTGYHGYEVFECPPNGQGIIALIMLNILSAYELRRLDPLGAERLHLEIEAGRLAFRDRNAFVADPDLAEIPVERLLDLDYAAELRGHIDPGRAMAALPPSSIPLHADTVYLTVVDKDRNAVSFINSIFHSFGSGIMAPKSGILLQNRGFGFRLDPAHPNCIGPRKRPLHTIIPGMTRKDGRAVLPFGVMGGHYQPFGHVHLLTNLIDFGMDVQEGLDCPRVFHGEGGLVVERGIGAEARQGLADMGHKVVEAESPLGGGQAIQIDHGRGVLIGGSDPRKDGCALGY